MLKYRKDGRPTAGRGLPNNGHRGRRGSNNTKALKQMDLASDQLNSVEEGPGEDADEKGDLDVNDAED